MSRRPKRKLQLANGISGESIDSPVPSSSSSEEESHASLDSSQCSTASSRKGKKGNVGMVSSRVPWRKEEETFLLEHVEKYGLMWKRILIEGKSIFHPKRTNVSLKDKFRNLLKREEREGYKVDEEQEDFDEGVNDLKFTPRKRPRTSEFQTPSSVKKERRPSEINVDVWIQTKRNNIWKTTVTASTTFLGLKKMFKENSGIEFDDVLLFIKKTRVVAEDKYVVGNCAPDNESSPLVLYAWCDKLEK